MPLPNSTHPIQQGGSQPPDGSYIRWFQEVEAARTAGYITQAEMDEAIADAIDGIPQPTLSLIIQAESGLTQEGTVATGLVRHKLGGALTELTDIDIGAYGYNWNFSTVDATVTNAGLEWFHNSTSLDPGYLEKYTQVQSTKAIGDSALAYSDLYTSNDGSPSASFSSGTINTVGTVSRNTLLSQTNTYAVLGHSYSDSANPGNDHSALITLAATATSAKADIAGGLSITYTAQQSGYFDSGTTAPAHTTRLNYDGYFYATKFFGDGTGLTGVGLLADPLSQFAATTSAQLAATISDETGYSAGAVLVFSKAPTLENPVVGTQTAGDNSTKAASTAYADAAAAAISAFTDEKAQDAVGAMVDSTLVYVDGTPLLTRAAITGDITIAQASNSAVYARGKLVALANNWDAL